MKKFIKYFFIILGGLLISLILVVLVFVNIVKNDSVTKKDFSTEFIIELTYFHKTKGHYPKSLKELPIYSDKAFRSYIKNNSFQYSLHPNDISKYVISWRGGAMGWTGHRCTNYKSDIAPKHDGIVRIYNMQNGIVCTVTDLH